MPLQVNATQFIKKLRGATQSVLTRCSDDCLYVVKFANNPEGLISILSEVITARLGRHLGLPMPSFEYIHVGKWLLEHSPSIMMIVDGKYRNYDAGIHFGSKTNRLAGQTSNGLCLPELSLSSQIADPGTFAGALVLDAWTGGSDCREVIFSRSGPAASPHPLFIDHHRNLNGWQDSTSHVNSTAHYFRPEFYDFIRGWQSFEPWLSTAETTNRKTLCDLVHDLAPEWHVGPGFRNEIVAHLGRRQHLIRFQIANLRDRGVPLFLNWNGTTTLRSGAR